ncbi:M50 family metallopeptidase [Azotobacter armeniacus]
MDLRLFPPQGDAGDRRHTIYDPRTDLSYFLGAGELLVAQLFDGQRSLEDIAAHLAREHGKACSMKTLAAFEHKLIQLGLLADSLEAKSKKLLDPAIGISYGPLKALLMIPVLRMNPAVMLNFLYWHCRWLCTPGFAILGAGIILAALACIANGHEAFWQDTKAVYGGNASWLLWHYPVVVVSIFFHEIGHALTCRHYRVRITDFGIAVYLLLATGWARPLQGDWSALHKHQRIISIVMGPYASLLFAAIGVLLWQGTRTMLMGAGSSVGDALAFWHTIGVVMAVSSTMALIPTLLPMFNGDTYLAITELIGIPRLRQRAFGYVKGLGSRSPHKEHLSPRRKLLYWLTVAGTALGWVVVWALLVQLALLIYQWLFS